MLGKLDSRQKSAGSSRTAEFGSTFRTVSNMGSTVRDTNRPNSRERGNDELMMRPMSGTLDLSIVRDRDMIPDIPQQTSKLFSINQPKVYLPPVSINEYLCY